MESQQLLTQSEVLEDEIFASTKDAAKPAEEVPEPHDHGKKSYPTLPNELMANSLILQVYDVLMNDGGVSTHRINPFGLINSGDCGPCPAQKRISPSHSS